MHNTEQDEDMAEIFADMRRHRQEVRRERRDTWEILHAENRLPREWKKHSDTHYSCTVKGKRLDYWPGPKKWQYEGKIHRGEVMKFIARREK